MSFELLSVHRGDFLGASYTRELKRFYYTERSRSYSLRIYFIHSRERAILKIISSLMEDRNQFSANVLTTPQNFAKVCKKMFHLNKEAIRIVHEHQNSSAQKISCHCTQCTVPLSWSRYSIFYLRFLHSR